MDKKLKKETEARLVAAMHEILKSIHPGALSESKKKINAAGKMVARKFAKALAAVKKKKAKKRKPAKQVASKKAAAKPGARKKRSVKKGRK